MRHLKKVAIVLLVIFVGIQFVPTSRNINSEVLEADFIKTFEAPNIIADILRSSCYDCHSNNTNYPWYDRLQPASWIMERHIKKAKEELNLSEFGAYSKRKQKSKLKSIASQIKDGEMPLASYAFIHRGAILSEVESALLVNWVTFLRDSL
jgi:Haem-binding domain